MRLIDADALLDRIPNLYERREVSRWVEDAPTVDAVPVVRCKDCKWFNDFGCAIRIVDESDKPKETDFCSFGEKDGEQHE